MIFKINKLDLLWLSNFIALEIYFNFGTKSFWNEGINTCFNLECVLLGLNFDFFGGYLVVTARYLVVTARYCSFPLLVWTALLLFNSSFDEMLHFLTCFEYIIIDNNNCTMLTIFSTSFKGSLVIETTKNNNSYFWKQKVSWSFKPLK